MALCLEVSFASSARRDLHEYLTTNGRKETIGKNREIEQSLRKRQRIKKLLMSYWKEHLTEKRTSQQSKRPWSEYLRGQSSLKRIGQSEY